MSEYQYYEFRAIDRPLGRKEQDALRALSTRAEITSTGLTNTYHWGDFKGNPATLMERYFDAFVYVANWGTHRLMVRVPRRLLDAAAASEYCDDETLSLKAKGDHVVLEFCSDDESGDEDFVGGEHWMPSLVSLRDELMRGDLRALYLGWLASLARDGVDLDDDGLPEPPVPPGLAKLSAPLRALAEFLRVDDELIQVAAAGSAGEPPAGPSHVELAGWVRNLPAGEKDAYLLRFLTEEGDVPLRAELSKRFRESTAPKGPLAVPDATRRTAAQLLAARDALVEEKTRKASERDAKARARLEREQAEARAKYLDDLARREEATWREVDGLVATKRPKDYDRAVTLLVDLHDLAARVGRPADAVARLRELRQRHGGKPAFLKRLDDKKLPK